MKPALKMVKWLRIAGYCLAMAAVSGSLGAFAQEWKGLIGTPAPEWEVTGWFNSQPLSLEQLRGKVVLARWWTGPECPYCAASAPHLVQWDERYRRRGLVVVGIYHHKSPAPLTRAHVAQLVERYGFRFPVAIDPSWQSLERWWLKGSDRKWTSVSFLIDREGVIRHVHPGGVYSPAEARQIEEIIEELLTESRTELWIEPTGEAQ